MPGRASNLLWIARYAAASQWATRVVIYVKCIMAYLYAKWRIYLRGKIWPMRALETMTSGRFYEP